MKFHYNITYEGPRAHNFLIECWLNSGLKYSILVTLNKQRERCFNLKLEYHRIKSLYSNGSVILIFIHPRQTYAVFSELYKCVLVTLVVKFIFQVNKKRNRKYVFWRLLRCHYQYQKELLQSHLKQCTMMKWLQWKSLFDVYLMLLTYFLLLRSFVDHSHANETKILMSVLRINHQHGVIHQLLPNSTKCIFDWVV